MEQGQSPRTKVLLAPLIEITQLRPADKPSHVEMAPASAQSVIRPRPDTDTTETAAQTKYISLYNILCKTYF